MAAVLGSPSRAPALKRLKTPTLVIHGDADPLIPVRLGIQTAKIIPKAELLIVKGMGHWLPLETWPEILGSMVGFFKKTSRG